MPTTCRRCGRPTRTVALEDRKGRRVGELALDPEPHPDGDVLVGHGAGAQLRGPALDAAHRGRLKLYRLHLAGCPERTPPAAPVAPARLEVRPCTTVPTGTGTHVVDEDAPDASLCGREVAHVLAGIRKVRRPCRACARELTARVDAGDWTGPAGGRP